MCGWRRRDAPGALCGGTDAWQAPRSRRVAANHDDEGVHQPHQPRPPQRRQGQGKGPRRQRQRKGPSTRPGKAQARRLMAQARLCTPRILFSSPYCLYSFTPTTHPAALCPAACAGRTADNAADANTPTCATTNTTAATANTPTPTTNTGARIAC